MCDVSCEVSILVALFIVPSVNIPLSRTCELIKVDGFHVVVNNHNVWLFLQTKKDKKDKKDKKKDKKDKKRQKDKKDKKDKK